MLTVESHDRSVERGHRPQRAAGEDSLRDVWVHLSALALRYSRQFLILEIPIFIPIATTTMPPARGIPFLRLGFRPFYFFGALLALLVVPLWVAHLTASVALVPVVPALYWHAHEMIFGFAGAIIIGFLLTASQTWTGLRTTHGPALAALALLWVAARITAFTGPALLYAITDFALLPVVAIVLLRLLLRAGNTQNLPLVLILSLLATANLLFHASALGLVDISPLKALYAGLALITLMECVVGGRVIPAFTNSIVQGANIRVNTVVERVILGATCVGLALWVFAAPDTLAGRIGCGTLLTASIGHVVRLACWKPWLTLARPILWILPASYAFIPVGLGLLGLSLVRVVPISSGIHALAVGATGGLIMGMMCRSARGHTGRQIAASPTEVVAFVLVLFAAIVRVGVPLVAPAYTKTALIIAASAWSGAFFLFLLVFAIPLVKPRIDGRDG